MEKNNPEITYGGISFTGLLTVVFITLKLIGKIDWSWWWVLSPIWIPWVIFLGIIGLVIAGLVIFTIASFLLDR